MKEPNWLFIEDDNVYNGVFAALLEVERQDKKWGTNRRMNGLLWNAILSEEFGEASKEVLECDTAKLRAELVQVAAVALNWIKAIDRGDLLDWRT